MDILYIPFGVNQATDLVAAAEFWQKHSKNHCVIVQYGQESDPLDEIKVFNEPLRIFVLAHGIEHRNHQYYLASHGTKHPEKSRLNIRDIAHRFQHDFLYYKPYISAVNLYFCNNQKSEFSVARTFLNSLILFEQIPIHFFRGSLYAPDQGGQHFAFWNQQKRLLRDVQNTLFRTVNEPNHTDERPIREALKARSFRVFIEGSVLKRQQQVKTEIETRRAERHRIYRKKAMKLLTDECDSPSPH